MRLEVSSIPHGSAYKALGMHEGKSIFYLSTNMRLSLDFVVFSLLVVSSSFAAPAKECAYKIKEEIASPPGWIKHSEVPAGHLISLRIGLPQENFRQLEKQLYEVSDPAHERYGQHLSKEEVEALVAPHPTSLSAVNDWLNGFDLEEEDLVRSPAKDWITITVPVKMAEKMLDTVTFSLWLGSFSADIFSTL